MNSSHGTSTAVWYLFGSPLSAWTSIGRLKWCATYRLRGTTCHVWSPADFELSSAMHVSVDQPYRSWKTSQRVEIPSHGMAPAGRDEPCLTTPVTPDQVLDPIWYSHFQDGMEI